MINYDDMAAKIDLVTVVFDAFAIQVRMIMRIVIPSAKAMLAEFRRLGLIQPDPPLRRGPSHPHRKLHRKGYRRQR